MRGDRKSTRLNSSHVEISYAVFCLTPRPPTPTLFPYTTLFRSGHRHRDRPAQPRPHGPEHRPAQHRQHRGHQRQRPHDARRVDPVPLPHLYTVKEPALHCKDARRSEEHTSELQSRRDLVCRLLLDPATPDPYPLSLHDALPIWSPPPRPARPTTPARPGTPASSAPPTPRPPAPTSARRQARRSRTAPASLHCKGAGFTL